MGKSVQGFFMDQSDDFCVEYSGCTDSRQVTVHCALITSHANSWMCEVGVAQ